MGQGIGGVVLRILVYNESSHQIQFSPEDIYQAKTNFETFVKLLSHIKNSKVISKIQYFDILNVVLFEEYTVSNWLNDAQVNREIKQLFRILYDKFFSPIINDEELNEAYIIYDDKMIKSHGCSWAISSMDTPYVISARTASIWEQKKLNVIYQHLNNECEISEEEYLVCNISNFSDIDSIKEEDQHKLFMDITSAQDFWDNKDILFPNIIFCESVYDQIKHMSKPYIDSIINRLIIMNTYFSESHSSYDPDELGMKARSESDTVKTNPKLMKQRLFKTPSGEEKYFFDHISFMHDYRIHFIPNVEENKCCIGYIGKHLETAKY